MNPTMSARRVLALVCAVGLLTVATTALADEESDARKSGYLGVHLQNIDSSMAKALQLDESSGVLISDVVDDGPAAAAGLEDGDVVLEFDGEAIEDSGDLSRAVRGTEPGETVAVVVLREGKRKTLQVEVGERENEFVWISGDGDDTWSFHGDGDIRIDEFHGDDNARVIIKRMKDGEDVNVWVTGIDEERGFMGVHLDDLNEQLGEYFGVDEGEGALVTEVVEDSPAEAAGLQAGDVIVELDGHEIASAADVHETLAGTEVDQEIELVVMRKGDSRNIDLKLGEMPERDIQFFGDDDEYRIYAPKMLHKMPHMKRQMRVHATPHVEIIREHEAQEDLEEMREELDRMRAELEDMRQELKK